MGPEAASVVPSKPTGFCPAQHKKLLFASEGCKEGQREAMLETSWAPPHGAWGRGARQGAPALLQLPAVQEPTAKG